MLLINYRCTRLPEPLFKTREEWLQALIELMRPLFKSVNLTIPKNIRVSIGFTSGGKRGRSVGECWNEAASTDNHYEIFIRPDYTERQLNVDMTVVSILAHELIHACLPLGEKHGKNFKKAALGIGLQGKMTATVAGEAFITNITPLLKKVGIIPHSKLKTINMSGKKQQKNRHLKCKCAECGYQVRVTKNWLDIGLPVCPKHGEMELED